MRLPATPARRPGLLAPLRDARSWRIALVVGTLINLYGQLLVPWLDGRSPVLAGWLEGAREHPGTTALSTLLGFLFPLGVSLYSGAGARRQAAALVSLANFPDARPDPVFRAGPGGEILDMGERTRLLFAERGVVCARELLGEENWRRVRRGEVQGMRVHLATLGGWYLLSHAPGPADGINLYLTPVEQEPDPGA